MNTILENLKTFIDEKHGKDILLLDVQEKTSEFDYMMIITALNTSHIKALSDNIEEKMHELGREPRLKEGRGSGWILQDYNDIIIHIFDKDTREHYDLDRLWTTNA